MTVIANNTTKRHILQHFLLLQDTMISRGPEKQLRLVFERLSYVSARSQ